jgi:hypothetical protein
MQRNFYTKKTKDTFTNRNQYEGLQNSQCLNDKWQPIITIQVFVPYKKPILDIATPLFHTGHIILHNEGECFLLSAVRTTTTVLKTDYSMLTTT